MIDPETGIEYKRCTRCKELKPLKQYNRKFGTDDGKQPICKKCQKIINQIYPRRNSKPPKSTLDVKKKLESLNIPVVYGYNAGISYVDLAAFGFIPIEAKGSNPVKNRLNSYSWGITPRQRKKLKRKGFAILVANGNLKRYFVVPYNDPHFDTGRIVARLDSEYGNAKNWRWLKQYENAFDLIFDYVENFIIEARNA